MFGGNCLICDQTQCTTSTTGSTFLSEGNVLDCTAIPNCKTDSCSASGCAECNVGFYLNNGQCNACSDALLGCAECSSGTTCTSCADPALTVDADTNTCICNSQGTGPGYKNMFTDATSGLCGCNEGQFLVGGDVGCMDCTYLIPGCNSCSVVNWNSGIALDGIRLYGYGQADKYLSCDSCFDNHRFVEINLDTTVSSATIDYATLSMLALPD